MSKRPKWCRVVGCPVAIIAALAAMVPLAYIGDNAFKGDSLGQIFGIVCMIAGGCFVGRCVGALFFGRWDWFNTCNADYED